MNPPPEVLERLGAYPTAFLGGRLNRHWRVQRGQETLVLRCWSPAEPLESILWERALRDDLAAQGCPAPPDVSELLEVGGERFSLAAFLPGAPRAQKNSPEELRDRGRLLAEFHLATAHLSFPQRTGWRAARATLGDPQVGQAFERHPDAARSRLLLWHWQRAREQLDQARDGERPRLLHGDFTSWNLLFREKELCGLLDFELSRTDERVVDFALSWRGAYDDLIHAYHEVNPLTAAEWQVITPLWWATLLEGAYRDLRRGVQDDGWTERMLLRRSPLMGMEAYPG